MNRFSKVAIWTSAATGPGRVNGWLLCLGMLGAAPGCVSQLAYEEAQSAVEVEREAHRRAELRRGEVEQELSTLKAAVERREAELAEQERRLAEVDLNLKLAHQERDENGELVDQLRGELARAGDHLRVFSEQKDRLSEELRAVQRNSRRAEQLTGVVRDLTLLEAQALRAGAVELSVVGDNPALRVPAAALQGEQLAGDGARLVKSLARLSELHPEVGFVVSERADDGPALPNASLLGRISEALTAQGVAAERVTLDVAEADRGSGRGEPNQDPASGESGTGSSSVVFVIQVDEGRATGQPPEQSGAPQGSEPTPHPKPGDQVLDPASNIDG